MKNLHKVLIGTACVFALAIGAAFYFWVNLHKYLPPMFIPPDAYWVDMKKPLRSQVKTISVAGVRLTIPQMYIGSKLSLGEERDTLLLDVIWPEMKSILELKDRQEYERMWKEEHKTGQILLEDRRKKTPFDQFFSSLRTEFTKDEYIGKEYGLDKYILQPRAQEPTPHRQDIYLEKDKDGRIETFIICSIKDKFRVTPVCSERFLVGPLYFQISYNKENFLPEWRQQKQRAIDFVNSFKVQQ